MKRVPFTIDDHGVSGIGAAVVADNHVMPGGQKINDFAFALIAPLKTDDGCIETGVLGADGKGCRSGSSQFLSRSTVIRVDPSSAIWDRETRKVTGPIRTVSASESSAWLTATPFNSVSL